MLEPLSVTRRDSNSRVEVEAAQVSLPLGDRGAKRRMRFPADALDRLPRTSAARDPAHDRCACNPRERR